MNAEDIAQYLRNNPQFFEDHASMLAEVTIPHPYSGRTISLNERQLLTLREQNRSLEKKLHELVKYAQDNDALQQKVHQFTLSLFGVRDLTDLKNVITQNLREIFAVPHVALRIWKEMPPGLEIQNFTDQQLQPDLYRLPCTGHFILVWRKRRSFAFVCLFTATCRRTIPRPANTGQ